MKKIFTALFTLLSFIAVSQTSRDSVISTISKNGVTNNNVVVSVPGAHYVVYTGQSNAQNQDITMNLWGYNTSPQILSFNASNVFATANPAINNIAYGDGLTAERNNVAFAYARNYLLDHPKDTVYILVSAKGSMPSSEWTPKTTGNGEVTATNTMLTDLFTKLGNTPSWFKADVLLYSQGEQDDAVGNIPYYLNNVIEFRDSCANSSKFKSGFTMILNYPVYAKGRGLYDSLSKALDSVAFGRKNTTGKNMLVAAFDFPNITGDSSHFTNESIDLIGAMDYNVYKNKLSFRQILRDTDYVKPGSGFVFTSTPLILNGAIKAGTSYGMEVHQNGSTNLLLATRYDAGAAGRQQGIGIESNNSLTGGTYFLHKAENYSAQLSNRNGFLWKDTTVGYVDSNLVQRSIVIGSFSINLTSSIITNGAITSSNIISTSAGLISRGSSTTYRALNIGTSDNNTGSYGELYFSVASGTNGSPAAAIRGIRGASGGALGIYLSAAFSTPALAMYFDNAGHIALGGSTSPTSWLTLPAGTAAANTAPAKFTAGTNLTAVENGAVEFDGTNYFLSSGGVRYTLVRILTGTAAPATTPAAVGIQFVDTTNKKLYVATGTASSADWTILN